MEAKVQQIYAKTIHAQHNSIMTHVPSFSVDRPSTANNTVALTSIIILQRLTLALTGTMVHRSSRMEPLYSQLEYADPYVLALPYRVCIPSACRPSSRSCFPSRCHGPCGMSEYHWAYNVLVTHKRPVEKLEHETMTYESSPLSVRGVPVFEHR